MAGQALVFGDINMDLVARLDAPLAPHGDNLPQSFEPHLGGVGANTAVALARWGVPTRLAGCAGRDPWGDMALRLLAENGVDTTLVTRTDTPTGLVIIPVDPDGRRTIIGSRGANQAAPAASPADALRGVGRVHLVGYSFLSEATAAWAADVVRLAQQQSVAVALDVGVAPARAARQAILALAPQLETLLVGIEEAEALAGCTGSASLDALARCGAATVIVKRGAEGCQFRESDRWWLLPPFAVNAVDTTGAGDAFAAAYHAAKLRGWATGDAVAVANAAGAAAAATKGAGEAMPGRTAVLALVERAADGTPAGKLAARLVRLLRADGKSEKVGTA